MSIIKKLLVPVAVAAVVSLGLVGCDKMGKKPAVEHPSKEKSSDEHPSGEHPMPSIDVIAVMSDGKLSRKVWYRSWLSSFANIADATSWDIDTWSVP